jgi:hypothetical protein
MDAWNMIERCEVGQRLIPKRAFKRWQNVFCSRTLSEEGNEIAVNL